MLQVMLMRWGRIGFRRREIGDSFRLTRSRMESIGLLMWGIALLCLLTPVGYGEKHTKKSISAMAPACGQNPEKSKKYAY